MSEKLLSGACDNCPLRNKIDCETAENKNVITHHIGGLSEWSTPKLEYISYEFTDAPNHPDAQRIELRTLQTDAFMSAVNVAVEAKKEEVGRRWSSAKQNTIDDAVRDVSIQMVAQKAKRDSLKESLSESITDCEGPEKDDSAFILRRKKCGADIVDRVIPRYVMKQRNYDAAMLKRYGAVWTVVETLGKFRPIR